MCDDPSHAATIPARGSRRRRLWELPMQALCPVIGVCIPMPVLRKRVDKQLGGSALADDYELHCGAINACGQRTAMAELLQKELDQRYLRAIRLAAQHKTTVALDLWWKAEHAGSEVAGALWATLTHSRCDAALQERVLRDIHMLQHQVGSANRADLQQLDALTDENAVLARELARAQDRSTRLLAERAQQIEQQAAELVQLRAELLGRNTLIASLREEFSALEAAVPGLRHRQEQATQIRMQLARIHELERALLAVAEQQAVENRRETTASISSVSASDPTVQPEPALPALDDRSVLCVGGRRAVVPIYRQLIERTGGRFLHHDGGEEDAVAKLDADLAAADLVICQTGCISHDAYWRVKDHCKRHGKTCVFVGNPSSSGLRRALCKLSDAGSAEAGAIPTRHTD